MKKEKQQSPKPAYDALDAGLPSSAWIEELILSIPLLRPDRMDELAIITRLDYFSTEVNRLIWASCVRLNESGIPPVVHAVADDLHRHGLLEAVTRGRLADLQREAIDIPDPAKYVRILRDNYIRRRAIFVANDLQLRAGGRNCDTAMALAEAAETLSGLGRDLEPESRLKTLAQILAETGGVNSYSSMVRRPGIVKTPFERLNNLLPCYGFEPGDLIVLAGHTSQGKTAMAINIAAEACQTRIPTAFVTLEMPERAIRDRLLTYVTGLSRYRLYRDAATLAGEADRMQSIREGEEHLAQLPMRVIYSPGISVKALQNDLRQMKTAEGLGLVVVDYLQLMGAGLRDGANRTEQVGAITRSLKRMAGELDVPVIALCQFSRESAKENREPTLYDLRESGSIEQGAGIVLLIHFTRRWDVAAGIDTGEAKLILGKQRNGATSWLTLDFHAPTGRFTEPSARVSGRKDLDG